MVTRGLGASAALNLPRPGRCLRQDRHQGFGRSGHRDQRRSRTRHAASQRPDHRQASEIPDPRFDPKSIRRPACRQAIAFARQPPRSRRPLGDCRIAPDRSARPFTDASNPNLALAPRSVGDRDQLGGGRWQRQPSSTGGRYGIHTAGSCRTAPITRDDIDLSPRGVTGQQRYATPARPPNG
jgi:hypothetical protein